MSEVQAHRTRVVAAPLAAPWAEQGLLEVFRHRYILSLLVRREIAARYQGSVLGLVWSYVNPLTQFFIYYFVMGILFGRAQQTQAFAIHVFAGLIIVHFFIETMNAGTRSIVRNKSLVQKMAVPREMFPVASMLVSLFHVIPQVIILLIATLLFGWRPDPWGMVYGVMALLIIMTLGTALALVFSAANVFLRDVSNAVNVLSNFVRFGVPMMYPYSLVAQKFRGHTGIYLANPITEAVLDFQRAFWVGATSHPKATIAHDMPPHLALLSLRALLISLVVLAFAQSTFSRLERRIPERLL
ncbi:ABC transporter permease [Nocardioides cynanchi]|uniref:ABC transporter permease n=1 Tax=Nocardioides cynanchi TaxID=2558918 RepID=UPI0012459414|nr:ABC transporter permease [Nocardioides cynanchi]